MIHEETIKAVHYDPKSFEGAKIEGGWRHVTRVDFDDLKLFHNGVELEEDADSSHLGHDGFEWRGDVTFYTFAGGSLSGHGGVRDSFTLPHDTLIEAYFDDLCCPHGKYMGGPGSWDIVCYWCEGGYSDEEYEAHWVQRDHGQALDAYEKEVFGWLIKTLGTIPKESVNEVFTPDLMEKMTFISRTCRTRAEQAGIRR